VTQVYDDLDAHLGADVDIAQASIPMGMLLAWCANMHLLSADVLQAHERLVLRLRFEDALGSELLIACGGTLSRDLFNAEGQRFLDGYYPEYMQVFRSVFGEDCYSLADTWTTYRQLAPVLTRAYLGEPNRRSSSEAGGLLGWLARWWRR